jgi:hypothetical protein
MFEGQMLQTAPRTMSIHDFFEHCHACGGNWTQMILTGIKEVFPVKWESLPSDKVYNFNEVCELLRECGVTLE